MKFKVLVINLDSSKERLTSMQQQCARLGIAFERVSAVRGSLLSETEKANVYNRQTNQHKYYKLLNDGEIGCYMSHVRCWEKIIADDLDFALILEDDAILTSTIPQYISALDKLNANWDYIKLSHGRKQKSIDEQLDLENGLQLGTCAKLPSTTTGQFVSKEGAQKLLSTAFPIARPVDMDIQYWFEKDLRCLVVRPFPVLNGDFGSEINQVADRRKVKAQKWKKIWHKILFELSIFIHRSHQGKLPQIHKA